MHNAFLLMSLLHQLFLVQILLPLLVPSHLLTLFLLSFFSPPLLFLVSLVLPYLIFPLHLLYLLPLLFLALLPFLLLPHLLPLFLFQSIIILYLQDQN